MTIDGSSTVRNSCKCLQSVWRKASPNKKPLLGGTGKSGLHGDPSACTRKPCLGNTLARKCLAGMLIITQISFSGLQTQFVRYYPNFLYSSLYSLPVISKLERFLADVAVFPSSTLTAGFQCLRHFQARLFPRRSSCSQKGLGSRLRTGLPTVQFLKLQHFGQKL